MNVAPESLTRRSFLYRELARLGARFEEINGCAVAVDCGDPAGEAEAARRLALADLSALGRCGYKGPRTLDWLRRHDVRIGEADNQAYRQDGGALAARLAPTELLLLGALDGSEPGPTRAATASAEPAPGVYPVPRASANVWMAVTGEAAARMFAKVCGVDLRPAKFADGAIAQTSLARLNAIIIRDDKGGVAVYHVLADSAAAVYLWMSLRDAMDEWGGRAVGLAAIRRLEPPSQ